MTEQDIVKILAAARFKLRSDTLKNWKDLNPVLLSGEPGIVIDGIETEKIKFGDGKTPWNELGWWKGPKGDKGDKGDNYILLSDKQEITDILKSTIDQAYDPKSENAQSGKAVAEALLTIDMSEKTTPEQESAKLGEELISSKGWIADGWTGNLSSGFTHTSGNTNSLIFTMPEDTGTKLYQVSFKCSIKPLPAMKLFVSVGNSATFDLYGYEDNDTTINVGIRSVENGNLEFIPAEDFTGTITDISIKEITSGYEGIRKVFDSNGNVTYEQHCTKQEFDNLFIGQNTGQMHTTGTGNVGIGTDVLANNTTGFWNVGIGRDTLKENTVGTRNLAIGNIALAKNKSGHRNIGIGTFALNQNETGNWNIAIGADSQDHCVSGEGNVSLGFGTLYQNVSGKWNLAIGHQTMASAVDVGGCIAIGRWAGYAVSASNNVLIGASAGYNIGGLENICIGNSAGKAGSNSTAQYNIFIGTSVGTKVIGANYNTIIGYQAGTSLTNGLNNIVIGRFAGSTLTTGQKNILIGDNVNTDAAGSHYQLNIGDLLKGSLRSSERYLSVNGGLELSQIPTTDPAVAGRVWNDNGTLKVSAG